MARRRPPPPTASPSRPSSKAKDYTTHREDAVQDELDELRNRGVAKFMNQHFTATTKKLAQEKAAADAALADLERRRAQTSEFVPSNGGELNPFDALYVELQQKRADCRRKEKETMLLYQRYKQKFKKKGPSPSKGASLETQPKPPPVREEQEETYGDDEEVMETPRKESPEQPADSCDETTPMVAAPPPSTSPAQDPPGFSPSPVKDLRDTMDSFPESSVADEPRATDPPAIPKTPAAVDKSMIIDCDESAPETPSAVLSTTVVETAKETPQVADEAPAPSPINSSPVLEVVSESRPTVEVTAAVPAAAMASDEDSDDDQRSVISGLTTVNSAVTRQVMEQLESEMEFFIENETKAIQKLLDAEEENISSTSRMNPDSDSSTACDQSVRASLKAEQMAEEMQKMLDQFQKEEMTTSSGSDTKDGSQPSASIKSSLYPRKFKSPNPNENWMVYWDEKFEREYYFESNSNRTQWEAPVMKLGFTDNPDFTPQQLPTRTSKLIASKRLSRSNLYRKKLRKQRQRRAICFLAVLIAVFLSAVHWKMNHSEKSYPDAMRATYYSLRDTYEYSFTNRTAEEQAAAALAARLEREKAQEAAERKRLEKLAAEKAEAERKRMAEEEAERKRREAEEKAKAEEAERLRLQEEEEQRLRLMEEERLEKERLAKANESLHRPWGCNLPFAHLAHSRCRKLAKSNPIYSEENLLNSFLQ
eukprot:scaffold25736_cov117-Cylindrotheca_fusiformis.AAC.1